MTATSATAKKTLLATLLLWAITVALFSRSLGFDFVNYDDGLYVYENTHTLAGLNPAGLAYAFQTDDGGSWMPLTWISYMADTSLLGVHPAVYRLTNVLLHAASAALLFLALHRMTKCFWRSALVAALFAVHPLRTESVVWIAERKDVLSAACFMLGLLAYAFYAEKRTPARYAAVCACLLPGLMAKPMVVSFPFVLLLLDFWPLKRAGNSRGEARHKLRPLVREKIPMLLACGLIAGATVWAQHQTGAVDTAHVPIWVKALQIADNHAFYIGKHFWPARLSVLYPLTAIVYWHATASALLLAGLSWWTIRQSFRFPWLAVGWFWFLGTLLPVIGVFSIGHINVADRYSYLPSVGLNILLAWGGFWLAERLAIRRAMAGVGAAAVLVLAAATHADLPRWKNSPSLYDSALQIGPHAVTYNNRGAARLTTGNPQGALADFNAAIRLKADYADAYANRATARIALGDFAEAISDGNKALKYAPESASAHSIRGTAHHKAGDRTNAMADFNAAIRLKPDCAAALCNRGSLWNDLGNTEAALRDCTEAIRQNPTLADAYNNRAIARSRGGDFSGALADYDTAIRLNPTKAAYYNNRGSQFFVLKQYGQASADLAKCRELGGQPQTNLAHDLNQAISGQLNR